MPRIALKELETDRSLMVDELEALIGRDPACGFLIEGPKSKVVSGRHARVFFQDASWWIQDMSRNGTILDDERLQSGQRHALRIGQLIGLGESGPRLRVTALESSVVSATVMEPVEPGLPSKTTAPRVRPLMGAPVAASEGTAAMRKSEALRAGVKFEEPTEPARFTGEWHVHVVLRATHSDQRQEARSLVVRVGRSPECHVRILPEQGASVSRIHAEIATAESGVVVRDAGSRNGTFLNGIRIEAAHPLVKGDKITLGAGGPTLEVDDLHIVKGSGPAQPQPSGASVGGGPTPDAQAARHTAAQPFSEPPTAPAPHGLSNAPSLPGTRFTAKPAASPPRGAPVAPVASPATSEADRKIPMVVWIGLAIVLLLIAVLIGRITAS